mmetsp:Transcript_6535/g.9869  ORF Transcript_6535/g.9869 Transcript_6535/m.9869 type:complete len:201 (-) Transcript_6535:11-613(-)
MYDLWATGSSQNQERKPKHAGIGMFDPISGQSVNPDRNEHSFLLRSVSKALEEKEACIKKYHQQAFEFKSPGESHQDPTPDSCQNTADDRASTQRHMPKEKRRHKQKKSHVSRGENSNSSTHERKAIIPEVYEKLPMTQREVLPNEIHPLDVVHKRLRLQGMVSRRKPVFQKRCHRSIRYKWSWVPYYRSHITTLRKDSS